MLIYFRVIRVPRDFVQKTEIIEAAYTESGSLNGLYCEFRRGLGEKLLSEMVLNRLFNSSVLTIQTFKRIYVVDEYRLAYYIKKRNSRRIVDSGRRCEPKK